MPNGRSKEVTDQYLDNFLGCDPTKWIVWILRYGFFDRNHAELVGLNTRANKLARISLYAGADHGGGVLNRRNS